MALKETAVSMFSGLKAILFLFAAMIAFTATYPVYKLIMTLEMSTQATVTLTIIFWLGAFTFVYMGTIWAYQGKYGSKTGQGRGGLFS